MLIDCSYFISGSRHIQNATIEANPTIDGEAVNMAIEAYIEEHQEEFLRRALGEKAGNKVNAYLTCIDEGDCVNQRNFEEICSRLKDSFADYVFFYILRDSSSQPTVTGLVRLKCANEYVSPLRRQVSAWNSMVNKNRKFAEWINSDSCPIKGIVVSEEMLTKINCLNL